MSTVWITHSGTGASVEVPEASLPMYRQSGWDLLPKKDVAALAKSELDAAAAADADMAPKTEETPPAQGTTPDKETS